MEEKIAQLEANVTLLNEANTQNHGIIASLTSSAMENNSEIGAMTTKITHLEQLMLKYEHNYKLMKQQMDFLKEQQLEFVKQQQQQLEFLKKRKREDDVAEGVLPEAAE